MGRKVESMIKNPLAGWMVAQNNAHKPQAAMGASWTQWPAAPPAPEVSPAHRAPASSVADRRLLCAHADRSTPAKRQYAQWDRREHPPGTIRVAGQQWQESTRFARGKPAPTYSPE